jgi:hypothetical protein
MLLGAVLYGQQVGTVGQAKPIPLTQPTPKPVAAASGAYSSAFDQNDLGKEWKILNPDENRWTMQPKRKSIMLITQKGGCPDTKDGKNQLVFDRDLPADDFEVIVKVATHFQVRGSYLAIALIRDEANYFRLVFQSEIDSYGRGHVFYFQKLFQGQLTGSYRADVGAAQDAYIKIERDGNEYTGSYALIDPAKPAAADPLQWINLGTLPWIRLQSKLLLCAANFEDAPEVSAEFFTVAVHRK